MATLYTKKNGGHGIKFTIDGERKELSLGAKYKPKTATKLTEIIEKLIACRDNHQIPDKQVFAYLEIAPPEIREKLETVGLIKQPKIRTLGQMWDAFELEDRDVKERTKERYKTARNQFFQFFKESTPLTDLTRDSLMDWRKHLVKKKYAEGSIVFYVSRVKAVLNWATDVKDLFAKSPGVGVKRGSSVNTERQFFIPKSVYFKLLEACRTQEQRTLLALVRVGGLRMPSEIANLTWDDILWDKKKIWIQSPKTERHKGRQGRFVYLWEPLGKELQALYFVDEPDGKDDRIFRKRNASSNLRTQFERIQKWAGVVPIPKFPTNCRSSRSTEVFNLYPQVEAESLMGHSTPIARQHYWNLQEAGTADCFAAKDLFGTDQEIDMKPTIGQKRSAPPGAKPTKPYELPVMQ